LIQYANSVPKLLILLTIGNMFQGLLIAGKSFLILSNHSVAMSHCHPSGSASFIQVDDAIVHGQGLSENVIPQSNKKEQPVGIHRLKRRIGQFYTRFQFPFVFLQQSSSHSSLWEIWVKLGRWIVYLVLVDKVWFSSLSFSAVTISGILKFFSGWGAACEKFSFSITSFAKR